VPINTPINQIFGVHVEASRDGGQEWALEMDGDGASGGGGAMGGFGVDVT
jgi:hypothetical protein